MQEIDWSAAPNWAMRKLKNKYGTPDAWADFGDKAVWINDYAAGSEATFRLDENAWTLIGERPSSPAWNGEGLPPVGAVCEYMWNYNRQGSEYVHVRILAHDGNCAIMRVVGGDHDNQLRESRTGDCGDHPIFRPIRTPEQKAAEEREAAIEVMCEETRLFGGQDKFIFGEIYDAGYRKVESKP